MESRDIDCVGIILQGPMNGIWLHEYPNRKDKKGIQKRPPRNPPSSPKPNIIQPIPNQNPQTPLPSQALAALVVLS